MITSSTSFVKLNSQFSNLLLNVTNKFKNIRIVSYAKVVLTLVAFYCLNCVNILLQENRTSKILFDAETKSTGKYTDLNNNVLRHQKRAIFSDENEDELKRLAKTKNSSIIFIGGYARSGTTLMRAILDVHPSVSCGPETKIIPLFLQFLTQTKSHQQTVDDIISSKLNFSTINEATSFFIEHILRNHISKIESKNDKRLCTKDPNILYYMEYLHKLFPNAKFVYMIRDGRAAAYSLMVKLKEKKLAHIFKSYLTTWNSYNAAVNRQCKILGPTYCKIIKYENLVLDSENQIRSVAHFLNLSWTNEFLHHEKYVGNKIVVSNTEWSTDQIKKKIYTESLNNWIGNIDYNVDTIKNILMLKEFGYEHNGVL